MNARVARGHTVLITGIGGGVALLALQLCLALGAHVYVTSGSDTKLARAVALGAAGGVNYTRSQSYVSACSCLTDRSLPPRQRIGQGRWQRPSETRCSTRSLTQLGGLLPSRSVGCFAPVGGSCSTG